MPLRVATVDHFGVQVVDEAAERGNAGSGMVDAVDGYIVSALGDDIIRNSRRGMFEA